VYKQLREKILQFKRTRNWKRDAPVASGLTTGRGMLKLEVDSQLGRGMIQLLVDSQLEEECSG
jgi:hypothetical protein